MHSSFSRMNSSFMSFSDGQEFQSQEKSQVPGIPYKTVVLKAVPKLLRRETH